MTFKWPLVLGTQWCGFLCYMSDDVRDMAYDNDDDEDSHTTPLPVLETLLNR